MKRQLRSNFPRGSYLWSVRNAQWQALGLSEADCEKPKIAVVNSSSELASCFSHLDQVSAVIKQAIRAAGAIPFEIRTCAPSDFITGAGARGGYILASRDLVTNDIEVAVEGAQLDGMVCLASCDKTVPGQIMAAARLNIPSLIVPCGYQASGEYKGKHVDIEEIFVGAMHALTGHLDKEELVAMSREAIRTPGVCSGMGTANSMHIATEALGMALSGSTPVAAMSEKMMKDVRLAGERIVRMVLDDLKPRDILTPQAFENAVTAVLAVGGSINCVKHLQAIASEAGLDIDVYRMFEQLSGRVPVLSAIRPVGEGTIEQFEAAGGTRALMKQLQDSLQPAPMTVSGLTVGQELADATVADPEIIRTAQNPVSSRPAIMILRGNLAPDCAIVKTGILERRRRQFTGPAICFFTSDAALKAISSGEVKPGQVLVMRGAGVCGGPAMGGGASRVVFALDGMSLGEEVAMLTDGHLSGLVCKGLVLAELAPEAATGGPLAMVEDGDSICIDLDTQRVDLLVSDEVLALRRQNWAAGPRLHDTGWLQIYRATVSPMGRGAVLTKPS
jgi:dihydroxy-acid dehydratase